MEKSEGEPRKTVQKSSCVLCGLECPSLGQLNRHMLVHSDTYVYCGCGRPFKWRVSLTKHQRKCDGQTGTRPYDRQNRSSKHLDIDSMPMVFLGGESSNPTVEPVAGPSKIEVLSVEVIKPADPDVRSNSASLDMPSLESPKLEVVDARKVSSACSLCGKMFTGHEIVFHMIDAHFSELKTACNTCKKIFRTTSELTDHLVQAHLLSG